MPSLHVGVIAPLWTPIPPPGGEGPAAVVDQLCRGLQSAGHSVTLFATGDSNCPVPTRWYVDRAPTGTGDTITELRHVQEAHAALAGVDVIHDHTILGPWWSQFHPGGPPTLTTAHDTITPHLSRLLEDLGKEVGIIALSHAQRMSAPEVPFVDVIPPGVDTDVFWMGNGDGGYVIFIGHLDPDGGAREAILAARAAHKPLLLAASRDDPSERRYFTQTIEPLLGSDAVFLGDISGERARGLLASAQALLNPIRGTEPFSMVMIEALACGTPVLTFDHGAASEVVTHGRTGWICSDSNDLVGHLGMIAQLDRGACRAAAETSFSTRRMVDDHVRLYERVAQEGVHAVVDRSSRTRAPETPDVLDGPQEIRLPQDEDARRS